MVPYLWGDVVGCPTECGGAVLPKHILLTHAKVSYLYMALAIQHHIVQLQVPEQSDMENIQREKARQVCV